MRPPTTRDIAMWLDIAQRIAKRSSCSRDSVGALLIDPTRSVIVADGRNGTTPGGADLCGGDRCDRDTLGIPSGQRMEVGCRHAEENALANAAQRGASTDGLWCIVTREPCGSCARKLEASGIVRVVTPEVGA